jgi:hypothetical protein
MPNSTSPLHPSKQLLAHVAHLPLPVASPANPVNQKAFIQEVQTPHRATPQTQVCHFSLKIQA